MEKFAQLIDYGRERLLNRVNQLITGDEELKDISPCKVGWQKALTDMSGLLIALMKNSYLPLYGTASISYDKEYVITYGTITGRKHRNRGVELESITTALQYFRLSFLELTELIEIKEYQQLFSRYTECFFDSFNIGVFRGYAELIENDFLHKIQEESFNVYNTKTKLRKVLESLPTPVLVVNRTLQVDFRNLAADKILLHCSIDEERLSYEGTIGALLPELIEHLRDFIDSSENEASINKQLFIHREANYQILLKKFYDYYKCEENVIIIMNDISDLVKLEQTRFLMESMSRFSGSIAHDFNNYLTVIRGNIDLMKRSLNKENSAGKVLKNLQEIEKAILMSGNLTQQLMSFAKGKEEPNRKTVNIANLLSDVVSLTAGGYELNCQLELEQDLWLTEIDECQISQVLSNLLINGGEAMAFNRDEPILVRAFNQRLAENQVTNLPAGKYVVINVEDRGIGIADDKIAKIFDYYFTTKKHGHGLGLANALNIVKRHNGIISVQSKLGIGSIFTIYLPAVD